MPLNRTRPMSFFSTTKMPGPTSLDLSTFLVARPHECREAQKIPLRSRRSPQPAARRSPAHTSPPYRDPWRLHSARATSTGKAAPRCREGPPSRHGRPLELRVRASRGRCGNFEVAFPRKARTRVECSGEPERPGDPKPDQGHVTIVQGHPRSPPAAVGVAAATAIRVRTACRPGCWHCSWRQSAGPDRHWRSCPDGAAGRERLGSSILARGSKYGHRRIPDACRR